MPTKKPATNEQTAIDTTGMNVWSKLLAVRNEFYAAGAKKTGRNLHAEFKLHMHGNSRTAYSHKPNTSIGNDHRVLKFLPGFIFTNQRQKILVADDSAPSIQLQSASNGYDVL